MSQSVESTPVAVPTDDIMPQAWAVLGDEPEMLTYTRMIPACAALSLGLTQYLSKLGIDWRGRIIRFQKFYRVWAEPEDVAVFPSGAVITPEPATYDAAELTPSTVQVSDGSGRFVRLASEVRLAMAVTIWTTDPSERDGLASMIEDAMEPRESTTGLRLALPFYFGAHATYEKLAAFYDDDVLAAQRRRRRAVFTILGHVPQIIPVGDIVQLNASANVIVDDVAG